MHWFQQWLHEIVYIVLFIHTSHRPTVWSLSESHAVSTLVQPFFSRCFVLLSKYSSSSASYLNCLSCSKCWPSFKFRYSLTIESWWNPRPPVASAVTDTTVKNTGAPAPVASSAVTDTTVKNAGAPAAAAKDDEVTAAQLKPTAVVTAKDNTAALAAAIADANDQIPVSQGEFPSENYTAGWKVVPEGTRSLCGNYTAKETTYVSSRGVMQTHQPQDWQLGQEREYLREQERLREDAARTETSRQGNTLDLEREYREYRREQERLREEAARAEASRQGNTSTQGMMEGLSSLYNSAKAKGSGWFGSAKEKVSAKLFPPKEDPPGRRIYD